jgi:hypothetical protein
MSRPFDTLLGIARCENFSASNKIAPSPYGPALFRTRRKIRRFSFENQLIKRRAGVAAADQAGFSSSPCITLACLGYLLGAGR